MKVGTMLIICHFSRKYTYNSLIPVISLFNTEMDSSELPLKLVLIEMFSKNVAVEK